jgi:hypothetical protein
MLIALGLVVLSCFTFAVADAREWGSQVKVCHKAGYTSYDPLNDACKCITRAEWQSTTLTLGGESTIVYRVRCPE